MTDRVVLEKMRELNPEVDQKRLDELSGYMDRFVEDVESDKILKFIKRIKNASDEEILAISTEEMTEIQSIDYDNRAVAYYEDALLVIKTPKEERPLLLGDAFKTAWGKEKLEERMAEPQVQVLGLVVL